MQLIYKKLAKNLFIPKNLLTFAPAFETEEHWRDGRVVEVEWSITVVLKTTVLRGTGGSNPSLSAKSLA